MIQITYKQGNGYRCQCCRRTSTELQTFETRDEAIKWLSRIKALQSNRAHCEYEDEDDISVIEVREVSDVSIGLYADENMVKDLLLCWAAEDKQKKQCEKAEFEKKIELAERATLEMLKKRYEGENSK